MRRILVAVALIFATLCSTAALAEDAPPPAQKSTVIGKTVERPPRVVRRHARLAVPEYPDVNQVRAIINYEAARWGVSAAGLSNRAYCESNYHWWATNGQYVGVLQMGANAFYRGLRSIGTRKIVVKSVVIRRIHSRVYRRWSDGKVTRGRGRVVRQHVVVTRVGWLPKRPSMANAWVQIRIGAQALRGISAVHSSEWSCGA